MFLCVCSGDSCGQSRRVFGSSVSLNVISREFLQICNKHPLGLCDVSAKNVLVFTQNQKELADTAVVKLIVGVHFQTVLIVEISESNGPKPVICGDGRMRKNNIWPRLREKAKLGLRLTIICIIDGVCNSDGVQEK